jgi:hypothetical protein
MKNYLVYLERLQQEMIIESEVDFDKVSEWVDKRDTWSSRGDYAKITMLACFLTSLMYVKLETIGIFVMFVVLGFIAMLVNAYMMDRSNEYVKLANTESDKVYDANYKRIKELIINDGVEQLRQLRDWDKMCVLSKTDESNYHELLRIVRTICFNYHDI